MAEILVGERVINRAGESGVITCIENARISVDFQIRKARFSETAFEDGFLRYENEALQKELQEAIAQEELLAEQKKAEEERIANEQEKARKAVAAANAARAVVPADVIKFESIVRLIDPAPMHLNSVHKDDRELVQKIFDECEKNTQSLFEEFRPKMEYPKLTSHSRSKYCTGFLTKYLDCYVFRVFSRNDVYKKTVKNGVTVMESNTAEVLRVLQINGKLYNFTKNMAVSLGYYNNTVGNAKWRGSDMGTRVFLNEVICDCDCGYLNGYVSNKYTNARAALFINLLFLALVNNKAEIAFKNGAFESTYHIPRLVEYLEQFTPKQIDFASKNDVVHALPFIKKFGISDVELLRDLDSIMEEGRFGSVYSTLRRLCRRMNYDCSDLDRRIMNFVKNTENFNAAMYNDYLWEFTRIPITDVTTQDLFDRNYIEHHNALIQERMRACSEKTADEERKANEQYVKAAKEISWIDREENGYFILVPKTIADFKAEGNAQHNCVYKLRYYLKVVEKNSIIVFLRQKKDQPYVTIEYDYETFKVRQALGKYNKRIDSELYQYIVDLGKQLYYEMHALH